VALLFLLHEWLLRLAAIRRQFAADARDGHGWMLRIHARILRFLISRYDETTLDPGSRHPGESVDPRPTYCIVEPGDHPPRRRRDLSHLLRDVRRINADKRPRWRWWI
jgi:hypothetical protein